MPEPEPRWTDLVSLAVHEMRSPLNVLTGFLGLLLDGYGGAPTDLQRQALTAGEQAGRRLNDLLADLSDLARLESGRLVPDESPVPLHDLLRDVAARFLAPPDRVVRCDVEGEVPHARVLVDPQRMPRALAGMAAFVARNAPASPVVVLRAARHHDRVAISFTEAGATVGIHDLDSLAPLPATEGGLGLALPLARAIVARAGGVSGVAGSGQPVRLAVLLPAR